MRLRSILQRRPSAALGISLVALFVSLGGVGYAAVAIPNGSVGTPQLKNGAVTNSKLQSNSVTYKKITPGSVGAVRANLGQLQARVSEKCIAGTAIGAVANNGKVTCNASLPPEIGTTSNTVALTATPATVATATLTAGANYLALANPTVTVTGTGSSQRITASCTLTVGANTQTRTATIATGGSTDPTTESIPLQIAGTAATGGAATVACSAAPVTGTLPTTSATAAVNALQTASNG